MGKVTFKKALLIIALAVMPMSLFAQKEGNAQKPQNNNHWFIDIDGGGTTLAGDNQMFQLKDTRFDGRFGFGYAFAKHFSAYAKIGGGVLAGHKNNLFDVNNANYLNYNANISADLVSLIGGYREDRVFGLKLHAGIGQNHYKAQSTAADGTVYNYGYKDVEGSVNGKGIGGRKVALEVPMGLEFNFNVSRLIDIYADFGTTFTDTDALDGFRHGKHKDWYATGNIGVRFKINNGKKAEPVKEEPVKEEPVVEPVKEEPAPVVVEPVYTDNKIELVFDAGKSVVNVEKSQASVNNFKNNLGDTRIDKIVIVGHASPEGEDNMNRNLSLDRAKAAKEYLMKELGDKVNGIDIMTSGEGADWEGFFAALAESNIARKSYIDRKINESSNKVGALWYMATKYPELKALYPALRRADITVTTVK